ncbi:MAG: hypothetical protein JXB50_11975 [Spirochaetes bacterium]|nr:hypothetical protein [Spirochaetota bacterium]
MKKDQMYEIKKITQDSRENIRRHFANKFFDLYIWISKADNEIVSFQLCYDINYNEKNLIWEKGRGYSHKNVDARWIQTPILTPDGIFDKKSVAVKFKEESMEIDKRISGFIYKKLIEYEQK